MQNQINRLFISLFLVLSFTLEIAAQKELDYSVFLIGDTGAPNLMGDDEVFTNLKKRLDQENKKSAIIFLGDNIYNNGLPPEDRTEEAEDRKIAKEKILLQLNALSDYKGEIYFIPGNHDWNDAKSDGIDYIRAQEEFIEFFLDRGDVLIPDHGCPGPEKKKLGKDVVLIAMDSQWWLHPHTDDQRDKASCKNKNTDDIIRELKQQLEDEEDNFIIVALHHPLYSDGGHNGYYQLKDHLFPFTALNSNLYIPLPVLGSLHPFYRSSFGAKQDMPHPLYQNLRDEILSTITTKRNIIFASGHEHNLQYFFKQNNHFIKSGSGSKSSPLPAINDAVFSNDSKGYAKLEFYKDKSVQLKYFIIKDGEEMLKFDQQIIEPSPEFGKKYGEYEIELSTIEKSASSLYDKGWFHKMVFGNLYRKDWSTHVTFRPINLSVEKGGLKPSKIGGGMSSKSIRLKASNKKQYVLRSVEKGVSKVVPEMFKNSVVQDIFQDQIAASQPYAALVVPPLADAVGVYHTNPEIVYLPEQAALGDYNDLYAGQLYLFEERPSGNQEDVEEFGNSRKIISYSDMLDKIQSTSSHHIHQDQVLRSRLLDIYLGDWDRHDDQWRWASFKELNLEGTEEHTYYEPIPRDRDQVLFKYQGLMPSLSKMLSPELRKFQTFKSDIKNLKYLVYNARHFDRSYLNELEREDWITIADKMTKGLTDEVIDEAIQRLPAPILIYRNEEYRKAFIDRRAQLKKWALDHYKFLSKYVDVVGTNKDEYFKGIRNPDGTLHVEVYQVKKNGDLDDKIYERTFLPDETKEVRLYGLSGDDQFVLEGESRKGPLIRVLGGKGNDKVDDKSKLRGGKKSTYTYDKLSDNGMEPGPDGKDERTDDYHVNLYDRKEYYYNSSIGIPFFAFNPDDGLVIQYAHDLRTYGFRKSPYNSRHTIGFRYALSTSQFRLNYQAHYKNVFGKADFALNTYFHLPDNVSNFFGLTNVQNFNVSDFDDFNFFRYDQSDILVEPAVLWSSPRMSSTFRLGPYFRYVDVGDNTDKFISDLDASGLSESQFDNASYLGIRASYQLTRIDNPSYPTIGINFNFTPSYNYNLSSSDDRFLSLHGALTLYNYLWIPKPFVLATKIEAGINYGDFNFYQGHYIGQSNGLRGFRNNRFGGKSSLLFTNDLRIKAFTTKGGALPISLGLMGAYDFGRVWNPGEGDTRWHQSYGGGIFISPFDIMPISFYYLKSTEGTSNFLIKLGFAI